MELLTLKQVAEHLRLSERTVYRLLRKGDLPGRKVGGHWRFRPSEVEYWLDVRLGRMPHADLLELAGEWTDPSVMLSQLLDPANALIRVPAGTRQEIVTSFVHAVKFLEPVNAADLAQRVWEREELSSTATVDGVAFVHTARWHERALSQRGLLAVGRLEQPTDFGALNDTLTDTLFLVLAPNDRQHLVMLAEVACLCRIPGFLARLRDSSDPSAVVALVQEFERTLRGRRPASR